MSTNKPEKLSKSDYCYGSIDDTSNFSIVGQFDGEAVWTSGILTKTGREIENPSWPTVCKYLLDWFDGIGQIEAV